MSRIISPGNLYSKISEFLFLFNHMHDFFTFIYLLLFPGFTIRGLIEGIQNYEPNRIRREILRA